MHLKILLKVNCIIVNFFLKFTIFSINTYDLKFWKNLIVICDNFCLSFCKNFYFKVLSISSCSFEDIKNILFKQNRNDIKQLYYADIS